MNYFSSKKKWLAYLVLLTFVFTSIVPTGTVFAGETESAVPVYTVSEDGFATLKEAVDEANKTENGAVIELKKNIILNEKLTIKKNITLQGNATIIRGTAGTIFMVDKNATLTLDGGLIIDGGNNWTFDSKNYYADMAAGKTLTTGAKDSYTASAEGGINATAAMISISGTNGVVVMNKATIQNSWGKALFYVPTGAILTTNKDSLITHIHGRVVDTLEGIWTMKGGKIDGVYGHSLNGGLAYVSGSGIFNINGGEITGVTLLGLNANGNGILAQVYGKNAKMNISAGSIHDNASFSPGNGWGSVVYLNGKADKQCGEFTMTGGSITNTKSDHCTAFVANYPGTIELLGGTIEVDPSKAAWFDTLMYGDVTVAENMNIVGTEDAYFCVLGDKTYTLDIDGKISGGTMWLMYNQPVTGEGTITSDVLIKQDPSYFEHDGEVAIAGGNWLDSVITVDAVGLDTTLTVKAGTVINGKQVRVLNSVTSGDYSNTTEAAAVQAAAYVQEDSAQVESPVLYYHRLASAQQKDVVVTFDYNGGLDANGWSGVQVTAAEAFTPECPDPVKEGYKLTGWKYAVDSNPESLSMGAEDVYTKGEKISKSVRLIAQWSIPYVCYIEETGVYYKTLTEAVADANASEGKDTIVMIADIDFDSDKALSVTGNVTIISEKDDKDNIIPHTISRGAYTGTLFTVPKKSTLILDDGIVFDGSNNWIFNKELYENDLYNRVDNPISAYAYSAEGGTCGTAAAFVVDGTVTANDATFQNFFNTKDSNAGDGAIFKVNANASLYTDGAIINHVATYGANAIAHLSTNSKWYIKGDTVISNNFGGRNGGICRNDSGQIYMNGGTIKDTAGKNVNGTVFMMYGQGSAFYMTGGTICGNSSTFGVNNGRCAAVYLHENAYMQMTGGTICHNVGGTRGGIDSYKSSSVLDINRVDQDFDNTDWKESGIAAYTASNHPLIVDNVSLLDSTSHDVGHSFNFDTWWVTGGIYTQDVDEFCAKGYVCIPYEDSERTDDYIVVPGYRVNYYTVEEKNVTNDETGESTTEYETTLEMKLFHLLPRDKFWYEMDERADYYELHNDAGGTISTWYTEKELTNIYDFDTPLVEDIDLYGKWDVKADVESEEFLVTKTVKGDNAPNPDNEYEFQLKIDARVEKWTAVLATKKQELKRAIEKAEADLKKAKDAVSESEIAFEANAVTFTTGSAYKFVMADEPVTTSGSALEYAHTIADQSGNISTTTSSAILWDGLTTNKEETAIDAVIDTIKTIAKGFANLFQNGWKVDLLQALNVAESSTPSALGFYTKDAEALLKAENDKLAAEENIKAAKIALEDFMKNEATTPTAIKVTFTPQEGSESRLESKVFELAPNANGHVIGFNLFGGTGYKVNVEATTGAMVTYRVSEVGGFATEDYLNTQVSVDGKLVATGAPDAGLVRNTGELTLAGNIIEFINNYRNNGNNNNENDNTNNDDNDDDNTTTDPEETIDDPKVPLGDVDTPEEIIDDPEIPLGDIEVPGEPVVEDELEDPEVPLGDAPATGDSANAVPFMALLAAAIGGLAITRRKFN